MTVDKLYLQVSTVRTSEAKLAKKEVGRLANNQT